MALYAVTSAASLGLVAPFMKVLFENGSSAPGWVGSVAGHATPDRLAGWPGPLKRLVQGALLDADDLWHREKLARHVALLDARPSVGLSYSASRLIGDTGADLGMTQWPQRGTANADDVLCRNPVGNGSAAVLRRADDPTPASAPLQWPRRYP